MQTIIFADKQQTETEKQGNRETEKQGNRETEKQRNRETEKQRNSLINQKIDLPLK